MEYGQEREHFLKNEKIQVFLRIVLVSIFLVSAFYVYERDGHLGDYPFSTIVLLPFLVIFFNLFYYFYFLKHLSFLYQKSRVVAIMVLDIVATVTVMYTIGGFAIYYPGVLLWYIVGYGARYGVRIAYASYATVIVSWSMLLLYSHYWQEHLDAGLGWLFAYIVLPLYYFQLITELQKRIDMLHEDVSEFTFRAGHDILTQLPNRLLFEKKLQESVKEYQRSGKKFALFFIDLDGFKEINDLYGHEMGDQVLIEVAQRISSVNSFTARLGGDEFVSIVSYSSQSELEERASLLLTNISKECKDKRVQLSASIGIACYPDGAQSLFELKKNSDKAMYKAKQDGKNRVCFYSID